MNNYNPLEYLPSSAQLPDSDDTPVDNEFILSIIIIESSGSILLPGVKEQANYMIVAKAGKMPALPGKIKTYKINKDKNYHDNMQWEHLAR